TFAIRIKNHTLISELFIIRLCRKLLGLIKATGKLIMKFVEGITIYWKIILTTLLIGILNSFIMILVYASAAALLLYMLFWCAVILAVCYIASVLKKLQIAGERLAAGDLTYHVDTSRMIWDFKRHGENLNSISAGMSRAVDERVKSERFKTELITNVSHDIKTPLTSIINYIDLLGKEEEKLRGTPCENTKIREYTQVIARQSARLKKLTEDLIEASKASTGNITVTLEKSDLNVLLSQAMGEYGERFENYGLDMIVRMPNEPVYIMADGRHLFRVFDNLMNNIIKYAMPGTRVYLTLENKDGRALIIFRNISKYALDLAPDELTERFVRGDLSRNSEGSGLGLSIAKSLTELQGGQFKIDTDADLFKVTLSFPVISGE
ncbi:MAG: HAMP domain-containing histidine kinase, partial [Clostridiales bacterium]|nr:HAMP domain-containing histidine kinase [Clostridiales bacterium]